MLATLGIDPGHLDATGNKCFCTPCFNSAHEVFQHGDPPAPCVHPIGWVRFGTKCNQADVDAASYVAYHGTRSWLAPIILRNRGLLLPNTVDIDGEHVEVPEGHYRDGQYLLVPTPAHAASFPRPKYVLQQRNFAAAILAEAQQLKRDLTSDEVATRRVQLMDFDRQQHKDAEVFRPSGFIFTSPSIKYASNQAFAPAVDGGQEGHQFQVVFQVLQRQDSFSVLGETVGLRFQGIERLDDAFPNDELEWFTDRTSAITITAILIRVTDRRAAPAWPHVQAMMDMPPYADDDIFTNLSAVNTLANPNPAASVTLSSHISAEAGADVSEFESEVEAAAELRDMHDYTTIEEMEDPGYLDPYNI